MNEDYKNFKKNGYITFESGLNNLEISNLRKLLLKHVEDGDSCEFCIDYALQNKDVYKTLFKKNIIKKLNNLSENIYYLTDLNIQINKISVSGRKKGWHIDANFEHYLKSDYLFSQDYRFYKVGIFLQDNLLNYGGGIDLKKASHKSFKNLGKKTLNYLYNFIFSKFPKKKYRVPTKAGDVIIFDSRLAHSSSSSQISTNKIKKDNMKIVLYWDVAGRLQDAENYLNSIIVKTFVNQKLDNNIFNLNFLSHNYPNSFNDFHKDLISKSGISFCSLDSDGSSYFEKIYKKKNNKFLDKDSPFLKL